MLAITPEQAQKIVIYLQRCPWAEVNELMVILSQLKPIKQAAE